MTGILKMPRLGETMEQGRLVAWLVEPGQMFKRGDALLEVETDKTVVEFPALGAGALMESLVELGAMVDVGAPIAKIDIGSGPDWTDDGNEKKAGPEESGPGSASAPARDSAPDRPVKQTAGMLRATPLARRLAKKNAVDIAELTGSGRRGRVERRDVEAVLTEPALPLESGPQTGHGVAWLEKGDETGVPVLFVHGFAADHTAWAGLQSQMARAGGRTLAVDLPSHGAATLEALDIDDLHPPLQTVARERLGRAPIHLVAHSMGAMAALRLAQTRPAASLTLIAPAGVGRRIDGIFLDALARPKNADHVKSTLKRLTAGPNGLSDAAIQSLYERLSQGRVSALAEALAGASGQAVDIRLPLAALAADIPVNLLLGHRDRILDWSEALDISPLIGVHHFPDAGHMPQWEATVEVLAILQRQINR